MDKKERYYNFIVDDLIKKTEIDDNKRIISFPPKPHLLSRRYIHYSEVIFLKLSSVFYTYILKRYGVQNDEVEMIWGLYRERILTLINL